ncbi:AlpA family phage regulatory protein [Salmonella enterica]|nr:AlpA family phage regulatory protein [Salmonella enterica]EBM7685460.1 AlpA family phage regulatory protein [Salmonella enterica subsp. enterica serovar Muenchen]ELJ2701305.1 AlpA family phage regulatory protein [Salmonella enterica subsp. enterica]EAO4948468.1 AlpA family phage regulatory protein [Salmonella enterica]EAP4861069.1 AlpA family phage regulatory protein [Salmonella enterica]
MSTNEDILFTKDVMKILRYGAMSAFIQFWQDKENNFPQPFKIGRRHTWYKEDVQNWLDKQRNKALQQ